MEEEVEVAKQLITGLLERIGAQARAEGFVEEGSLYLEIKSDQEGILIGRYGRTLDSLEILINRMVNKRMVRPVRVVLDIDDYRKRRADTLTPAAEGHGLWPWMNAPAFGRDVAPLGREVGCHGLCPWGSTKMALRYGGESQEGRPPPDHWPI